MNHKIAMNNAHPSYLGWQIDWPLYVKSPILKAQGKVYKKHDYFPWAELSLDPAKVAAMYKQGLLNHDAVKSKEEGQGDRLGEMTADNLKKLANNLNTKMKKEHSATEEEFKRKRCRMSSLPDHQRRYIRQFLSKNPYMTDYFLSIRDNYITKYTKEED